MNISNKNDLREKVLALLRGQKEEKRLEKSSIIQQKLFNMDEFSNSSNILFYASTDEEVITTHMIIESLKAGKTVGLPYIDSKSSKILPRVIQDFKNDIEIGPYEIKQPRKTQYNEMSVIDMVIVPGVAFDRSGNRLGRGGGYYDRFLSSLNKQTITVGLAYDVQMFDQLPSLQDHDVPVMHILTN